MYFFTIMIIIAVFTMFCLTFFGSEIKCFIDWKRNCDESQECKRWREWKAKCRERKCVYFGEVRNCQYKYTITIGLDTGTKIEFYLYSNTARFSFRELVDRCENISYIKNPRLKQKDFLRIIFPQESITDESVETVIVTTSIEYINVKCEEK